MIYNDWYLRHRNLDVIVELEVEKNLEQSLFQLMYLSSGTLKIQWNVIFNVRLQLIQL